MTLAVPFLFGVLVTLPSAIRETTAAAHQRVVEGKVSSYRRSDHNSCSYAFSVSGKAYSGRDSAPTDSVTIGQRVRVYYSDQDPSLNGLGDFSERAGQDEGAAGLCLFGIASLVGVVLYRKKKSASQRLLHSFNGR